VSALERLEVRLAEQPQAKAKKDVFTGDGIMVAIWPPKQVAADLAVARGEPASKLHITLAFIGKRSELGIGTTYPALEKVVREVGARHGPLTIGLGATGKFPITENSDGKHPFYASVVSPGLLAVRRDLVASLKAAGVSYSTDHGFKPHMTLAYLEPGQVEPKVSPDSSFVADRFGAAIGGRRVMVPFGSSALETKSRRSP